MCVEGGKFNCLLFEIEKVVICLKQRGEDGHSLMCKKAVARGFIFFGVIPCQPEEILFGDRNFAQCCKEMSSCQVGVFFVWMFELKCSVGIEKGEMELFLFTPFIACKKRSFAMVDT